GPAQARTLTRVSFRSELPGCLRCELLPGPLDLREIGTAQQTAKRASVVMLDVGIKQAERGEEARRWRDDDAANAQRIGHAAGEQRPVAAECEQGELPRVAAALGRHCLDSPDHVR